MSSSTTAASLYAATISQATISAATPEDAKDKRHHLKNGQGFQNPWPSWRDFNGPALAAGLLWRKITGEMHVPDTTPPTVPVTKPHFLPTRQTPKLRATWLGHACYYVEFPSGLRVLFDPVFSERCSPFSWLGPKRYTDTPVDVDGIPIVDAVVISHNHYDHLDHPTIMKLHQKHPNVHFFAPLGNKQWFNASGITNMTELDWWESRDMRLAPSDTRPDVVKIDKEATSPGESKHDSILGTIGCLPCQHTSARTGWDKSRTLWSSWSIESGGKKVWFGGDTGYRAVPKLAKGVDDYGSDQNFPSCPAFKDIGLHRGPFDLGLIPIGAYDPRHIMSPMHANPFDSVNIHIDTRCRRSMGIHWGTWVLTEEDVMEPPKLLRKALAWKGLAETGVFDVCDIGESREFD